MIRILIISIIIDILIADPLWLYHPVQLIGLFSIKTESVLRKVKFISLYILGFIHWIVVVTIFVGLFLILRKLLFSNKLLLDIFFIYLTYSLIAIGSLVREARSIYRSLKDNQINKARERVQSIVSRNMDNANEHDIVRATIETVTENLSDGIIAPLFYYSIGGPFGILLYKIVNTLDSMIAYKNEKYIKYGWFSAKIDDLLNYIPARITGVILIIIAFIRKGSVKGSILAWRRDAQKGPSPNGGIPIVTYAGARNIKLGGPCFDKEGKIIDIPFVGGIKSFNKDEIKEVIYYTYISSIIMSIISLITITLISNNLY